ncbi:hypothetical protein [Microbacterium paludicola]|uniref:hypothetical protein n=1 Tax=Microbacterium paludicola TaxID=300019 RepID=UPI0031D41698
MTGRHGGRRGRGIPSGQLLFAGRGVGGGGARRGVLAHTARGAAALILSLIVLVGAVNASAATLGGASAHSLGAASTANARASGVTIDWTGTPSGAAWNVDGATVRAEGGSFAAGDTVKLTVAPAAGHTGAPCEVRTTPAAASATVAFPAAAFAACGVLRFDRLGTVAVAVSGAQVAVAASRVGDVRSALTAHSGPVLNADRALVARTEAVVDGGVSYVGRIAVDVTRGATVEDLVGERLDVALLGPDGTVRARVGGVISAAADAPVRVTMEAGSAIPTVVIDPRANLPRASWQRSGDVASVSGLLLAPQRIGEAPSPAPASLVSANAQPATPPVRYAIEAVALDPRLTYTYTTPANDRNSLSYCHTFSVTNTSAQPVTWQVVFDTSLPPLWGMDPTKAGAIGSQWGYVTKSYVAATHLWTIAGSGANAVLQPGQTLSGMGYCAADVPQPPVDPSGFTTAVSVVAGATDYHVQLRVSVRSDRIYNAPWEITVDLADYVCAASLTGKAITFSRVQATPVAGSRTKYVIRGLANDTQYVSASHSRDFVFASYSPGGPGWAKPCR